MAYKWDASTGIAGLVEKFGFEVHNQTMDGWAGKKKGAIKEIVVRGKNNNILIDAGDINEAGYIPDLGPTPYGGDAPKEATYTTKLYRVGVEIGRQAADETENVHKGVDLVKSAIRKAMRTASRHLARAFYGTSLYTLTGSVSAGSTTFTVTDATWAEPGMKFDVVRSGAVLETAEVTNRTTGAHGASKTITLSAATTNAWASGDILYLHGALDDGPSSLEDVCGSGTLYNVAGTAYNWHGTTKDMNNAFSRDDLEDLEDERYDLSGEEASHIIVSKKVARLIYRADKDLVRFGERSNLDARGKEALKVDAIEVVEDKEVGDDKGYIHCRDLVVHHTSLKLATDGSSNENFKKPDMIKSEVKNAYLVNLRTTHNIRPNMRACEAKFYNFT